MFKYRQHSFFTRCCYITVHTYKHVDALFCKWQLYEVQTPEQFEYECRRFRELCHDDWKSYMNFEVDKTVYIID